MPRHGAEPTESCEFCTLVARQLAEERGQATSAGFSDEHFLRAVGLWWVSVMLTRLGVAGTVSAYAALLEQVVSIDNAPILTKTIQ